MLRAIWSAFAHGRLRDTTLNVELFRRLVNGAGAIHVAFGLPPPSLADRWTFYPASFELTDSDPDMYGAPVHIRFTHLQHVAHDMDDAIKILTHTEGKATFEGKQHADYKGPCLWWSAPVPPPGNTSCPSLNRGDSRYGSVRFSFPVREVLSLHSKQYLLGTRHYNHEWAHTILLSSNEVHGLGAVLPRVDLADSALTQWPVGADATEATWKCYRHASDDWDHLEFACEIPQGKTLSFDPKKNQVKIDFVAHDKYCVKHLSSVNHSRKQPTALACRRVSSRAGPPVPRRLQCRGPESAQQAERLRILQRRCLATDPREVASPQTQVHQRGRGGAQQELHSENQVSGETRTLPQIIGSMAGLSVICLSLTVVSLSLVPVQSKEANRGSVSVT